LSQGQRMTWANDEQQGLGVQVLKG
jgi:hypothetical protein